jgi:excisionase family DNA binding protein
MNGAYIGGPTLEPLRTIEELATTLVVSPLTVRRLVERGDLTAVRVGRQLRVAQRDFEDYLERSREGRSSA